jgi:hypothetical protein
MSSPLLLLLLLPLLEKEELLLLLSLSLLLSLGIGGRRAAVTRRSVGLSALRRYRARML